MTFPVSAKRRSTMDPVYAVTEIIGTSEDSIEDAIETAVSTAGETLSNLGWFEVKEIRGQIAEDGEVSYQVRLKIGFRYARGER